MTTNVKIDGEWFLMITEHCTFLVHLCGANPHNDWDTQADKACWDPDKECYYCDFCNINAPKDVEQIALLNNATKSGTDTLGYVGSRGFKYRNVE